MRKMSNAEDINIHDFKFQNHNNKVKQYWQKTNKAKKIHISMTHNRDSKT